MGNAALRTFSALWSLTMTFLAPFNLVILILQTGKPRHTEEECCLALILVRSVAEPADAPPFYTNSL